MSSLARELEAALGHVVQALEHEDRGESFSAMSSYGQAQAQMQYAVDLLASSTQPMVLELCGGFVRGYAQRVQARLPAGCWCSSCTARRCAPPTSSPTSTRCVLLRLPVLAVHRHSHVSGVVGQVPTKTD